MLAEKGFQFVFVPAMGFHEGDHEFVHEGIGILSRYPIAASSHLSLSRNPDDPGDFHQRIALRATIESAIGPVDVVSTHMSLSENAQKTTLKELASWTSEV